MPVAAAVLNGVRAERFRADEEPALAALAADGRRAGLAAPRRPALRHLAEQRSDDGLPAAAGRGHGPAGARAARSWCGGASTCAALEELAEAPGRRRLPERPPVIEAIEGRRVVVCCGAGGVGKTTVSAGLGLGPGARRRANGGRDDRPRAAARHRPRDGGPVRRAAARARPGPGRSGAELWALQLDAKATFDRLVSREAPTPEARERILANRIYRHLSGAVAGAQDYMAVERLHELVDERLLRRHRARHAALAERARLPRRAGAHHPVHRGTGAAAAAAARLCPAPASGGG